MLELIAQDGSKLFVNPRAIWHIRSSGLDATAIYTTSGAALFVRGDAEKVALGVNAWFKAGIDRASSHPID
ncbi:hypothetical protein KZ810_14120 [Sphingomonas sp. RHCKR47]|nr:hypothetical protein [Sphingomonas citricola]